MKDAKVGETYLGMEPLTKFVSVTVSTAMGDVELCHPLDMVAESQRDMVRPGAVVSALCILSGDCAIGEYAGGLVFGQEQNFRLLADFLRRGGTERLRPILRSDCAVRFLENRQEGVENALSLLELAGRDMELACDEAAVRARAASAPACSPQPDSGAGPACWWGRTRSGLPSSAAWIRTAWAGCGSWRSAGTRTGSLTF